MAISFFLPLIVLVDIITAQDASTVVFTNNAPIANAPAKTTSIPRLLTTAPCSDMVNCFVAPCQFAQCATYPDAVCENNYCGGCNAIWTDRHTGKRLTDLDCQPSTSTTSPPRLPLLCAMDAYQCWDGSFVARDATSNCAFRACPPLPSVDYASCATVYCFTAPCPQPSCPGHADAVCAASKIFMDRFTGKLLTTADCNAPPQFVQPIVAKPLKPLAPIPSMSTASPISIRPCLMIYCATSPCAENSCPAYPNAMCTDDLCGGCKAIFTDRDSGRQLTETECHPSVPLPLPQRASTDPAPEFMPNSLPFHGTTVIFGNAANSVLEQGPPGRPKACTKDLYQCADGSVVARDGNRNCEFRACPQPETTSAATPSPTDPQTTTTTAAPETTTTTTTTTSAPEAVPDPFVCAKVGEVCTDEVATQADRCCDGGQNGSTKCLFSDTDSIGVRVGVCCVQNKASGCSQDSECCDAGDMCDVDGICIKPESQIRNELKAEAAKRVEGDFDDFELVQNGSGSRFVIISEASIAVILILVLFVFPITYYWYYRHYIVKRAQKMVKREIVHGLEVQPSHSDNEFVDTDEEQQGYVD